MGEPMFGWILLWSKPVTVVGVDVSEGMIVFIRKYNRNFHIFNGFREKGEAYLEVSSRNMHQTL
jgi:hypothetical protein